MRRWCGGWGGGVALVVLTLLMVTPGLFTLPAIDRDESRFVQASRQMFESVALPVDARDRTPIGVSASGGPVGGLHSGGLVVPMLADRARLNKPPMIYWLQAASAAVMTRGDPLCDAVWMYRLPSAMAAIIAVLVTWRIGLTMFDARAAWLGAAMLGACAVVAVDAHQARADQVLLAVTTIAMGVLWKAWRSEKPGVGLCVLLWLLVGVGVLTKGPITPMVVVLTAVVAAGWSRRWGWLVALRPMLGLLIVAGVVGPWVWGVASRVGFETYASIVFDETVGRSASAKEGHWGPPGYHAVLLVVLLWPGSLLALLAVRRAWRKSVGGGVGDRDGGGGGDRNGLVRRVWRGVVRRREGRSAELFLLAWIVPAWLVFEIVGTKLPHYTLPMYPAVALLSGRAVLAGMSGRLIGAGDRGSKFGFVIWGVVGVGLACVGVAAVWWAGLGFGVAGFLAWLLAAVALVLAVIAGVHAMRRRFVMATLAGIAMHVAFAWTMLGLVLPRVDDVWVTRQIAAVVAGNGRAGPIATTGYAEDSVVLLARGRLERLDVAGGGGAVVEWLDVRPGGAVVMFADEVEVLMQGLDVDGYVMTSVEGFNYAAGRRVRLFVVERRDAGMGVGVGDGGGEL